VEGKVKWERKLLKDEFQVSCKIEVIVGNAKVEFWNEWYCRNSFGKVFHNAEGRVRQ
jgi:hypothetical protein